MGWQIVRRVAFVFVLLGASAAMLPSSASAAPALSSGERRITVSDGTSLYVKVTGAGPVCMLVHGGPGQGTLSTEKMGADKLERFLTMVYVDQRGSGKSPDATDYHLSRVTQDFEDVRRALGIKRMCLIAHSFGGILAVDYARAHPDRVSSLVMANTTLQFLSPYNERMQIDFANQLLGKKVVTVPPNADRATLDTATDEARAAVMKSGQGYRFISRQLDGIKRMGELDASYPRSRGFGRAVFDQKDSYPEYYVDYAPVTRRITRPVLVITSREDYAVGPDEYRRFHFPHQTTVRLDGGHMSYYEQNAGFIDAIRHFLIGGRRSS